MVWNVPSENLKTGYLDGETRPVPITKPMLAVLEQAKLIAYPQISFKYAKYGHTVQIFERARHTPDQSTDALVFPNSTGGIFENSHVARFVRRTLKESKATPHGFRSTLRDWLRAETSFDDVLWKLQVDHKTGDKTDQSYGHDKLLEKRRGMMELWGEYCSKLAPEPKAGDVVKLSHKRRTI
jgi:integrase